MDKKKSTDWSQGEGFTDEKGLLWTDSKKREGKKKVLESLKKKGKKKLKKEREEAKNPVPNGFDDETDKLEKAQKPTQITGPN